MRRLLWIVPSLAAFAVTGYFLLRPSEAPADVTQQAPANAPATPALPTSSDLPVTQIVLYSSGVGFFQREGQVVGNARVDLTFPVRDINDLLKSMVLQDHGGGHVSAVAYDSHDPIDKTLDSFAIQLTNNPNQAEILNQARGEKVELTLLPKSGNDKSGPVTLQGTIVGVEVKSEGGKPVGRGQTSALDEFVASPVTTRSVDPLFGEKPPAKTAVVSSYYRAVSTGTGDPMATMNLRLLHGDPTEVLNLWCADGMRTVSLADIQRVKFLNPAVESEIARALEVVARTHDNQKKGVSLQFNGTGSRAVSVGYVVESPLWRTSYRLLVGKDGKLFVQGWALVNNPTNEDWKNVRMSLVSGRPISFKMDLHQPLYVPRPVVQQELHASVKPTVHNGKMMPEKALASGGVAGIDLNYVSGPENYAPAPQVAYPPKVTTASTPNAPVHLGNGHNVYDLDGDPGAYVDMKRPSIKFDSGVLAAASANDLGNSFEYAIDHTVTIPPQKSALLPIVNTGLEGDKVSLYSPRSHAKHPLLALRVKNTTGLHLMQGPVAVYEGTGYCGDAQLPDLQPNEERLVSYALDLGTEVEAVAGPRNEQTLSIKFHQGVLSTKGKATESMRYTVTNRSPHDRVVLVEHPNRPQYRLVSKDQPKEKARDVYRFEVKVAAGKSVKLEVTEESDVKWQHAVVNLDTPTVQRLLQFELSNAKAKEPLEKLLNLRDKVAATQKDTAGLEKQLADITADQARLRANLKEMPESAAAYKRYLEKFDTQETAIENLQTRIKEQRELTQKQMSDCESYLKGLEIEATVRRIPVVPAFDQAVPMGVDPELESPRVPR